METIRWNYGYSDEKRLEAQGRGFSWVCVRAVGRVKDKGGLRGNDPGLSFKPR